MRSRVGMVVFLALLVSVLCVPALFAQADRATITGMVRDPSGVALTGVDVRATNTATGVVFPGHTNEAGIYTISGLPVGSYTIQISQTGFKEYKRTDIQLSVAQVLQVNADLTVGSIAESVTVTALLSAAAAGSYAQPEIGQMDGGAHFVSIESHGKWGLAVTGSGMASAAQPEPIAFEFYQPPDVISRQSAGYDHVDLFARGALGIAHVAGPANTSFTIEDRWSVDGSVIQLSRKVTVTGTADYGFLTSVTFIHPDTYV